MPRTAIRRETESPEADSELTAAARRGEPGAFDELYRRHADAAWRVAYAIVHNQDDAGDAVAEAFSKVFRAFPAARAFRPYLLAAVRNCALDIVRRSQRCEPTGDLDGPDQAEDSVVAGVVAGEDDRIVARAFAQLPERWQRALWLIEVEQLSTKDAGAAMGVSANNAAQLASRARLRLREEYLQAHVPNHIRPQCTVTAAALGSFVAHTASRRTRTKVERHLETCADCRGRVAQLEDVGCVLRRAVLPLPLAAVGARGRRPLRELLRRLHGRVPAPTGRSIVEVVPQLTHLTASTPVMERLVAGATAAVLVVGVSVLAAGGHNPGSPEYAGTTVSPPAVTGDGSGASPLLPASPVSGATPGGGSAGASASGAPLGVANLSGPDLVGAVLSRADLWGANLVGAHLPGADLAGANLTGATLTDATLTDADLSGANLAGASLSGTNLSGANLAGANLSGANLAGATLPDANLADADLTGASVTGADLAGAVLTGTKLVTTDLRGVDLSRVDLRGADATGALFGLVPSGPPRAGAAPASLAAVLGVANTGPGPAPLTLPGLGLLAGGVPTRAPSYLGDSLTSSSSLALPSQPLPSLAPPLFTARPGGAAPSPPGPAPLAPLLPFLGAAAPTPVPTPVPTAVLPTTTSLAPAVTAATGALPGGPASVPPPVPTTIPAAIPAAIPAVSTTPALPALIGALVPALGMH